MKKNWNEPKIFDLAVKSTEAQKKPDGTHDGIVYEAEGWPDGIYGHS